MGTQQKGNPNPSQLNPNWAQLQQVAPLTLLSLFLFPFQFLMLSSSTLCSAEVKEQWLDAIKTLTQIRIGKPENHAR